MIARRIARRDRLTARSVGQSPRAIRGTRDQGDRLGDRTVRSGPITKPLGAWLALLTFSKIELGGVGKHLRREGTGTTCILITFMRREHDSGSKVTFFLLLFISFLGVSQLSIECCCQHESGRIAYFCGRIPGCKMQVYCP